MKQPKIYCATVEEARLIGWLDVREGCLSGRIYGRKPGNHRVFRCYVAEFCQPPF